MSEAPATAAPASGEPGSVKPGSAAKDRRQVRIRVPTRLRRAVQRIGDTMPPTWRGLMVAVLGSFALWQFGYREMDLVLFVIGLAGLVLLALASVVVAGSAAFLTKRLEPGGEHRLEAQTDAPYDTGFSAPALSALPLLEIEWQWLEPAGMECRQRLRDGRLREELVPRRRSLTGAMVRELNLRDAFGLTRISWQKRYARPIRILPHAGKLRAMPQVVSMASAEGLPHPAGSPEGDRMEIRRYVPGDSARHILWKTYARTRQLNVRVPERALDRTERTVAYLLAGPEDEAAAAAARVAIENGLLGARWLFAADGSPEPTEDLESALDAVARSGDFEPEDGAEPLAGLRAFLDHPEVSAEMHCVVFAAAHPGPWVDQALRLGAESGGALSFVLGTDGVASGNPPPLWRRLLFQRGDEPSTTVQELRTMLATFEKARCGAMVVDRESGRSHGRLETRPSAAIYRRAG
ncbi:MAG: DUF58 domain-containing protein [Acidobacteriota bacterium]